MINADLNWPEGLHSDLGPLVATLEDGTREWRSNLELPSLDAVCWSPFPEGPSIGGLILHMAGAELYWLQQVANGVDISPDHPAWEYDLNLDQYGPSWPTPPRQPIEWYFEIQDETRREMIELVKDHNDPTRQYQGSRRSMTYRWILAHIVEHDSYHGGQAVLLHEMYKKLH